MHPSPLRRGVSKKRPRTYAESLLDAVSSSTDAIAPRRWAYEIRNSVLTAIRRRRINRADADGFLHALGPASTSPIRSPMTVFSNWPKATV
jgi:hypothetical protein